MSVIKYGKTFPEFVKIFRKEHQMSQGDLGYMLGVHKQYVSNIERGVHKNCVAFASRMLGIVESNRKPYLIDLISENASEMVARKLENKL